MRGHMLDLPSRLSEPLKRHQVNRLREGATIYVKWSGNDTIIPYTFRRWYGLPYAQYQQSELSRWVALDFTGTKRPFDLVMVSLENNRDGEYQALPK